MDIIDIAHIINTRFTEYGFPLSNNNDVIPKNDDSTLFICSGMQKWKPKFEQETKERFGTLQSCIRMDDIDLVGDGSHLTSFKMLGNFSFGNNDYELSVDMWDAILTDLKLKHRCRIHVYPLNTEHLHMWIKRKYGYIMLDSECVWSDGAIGGYCCEVYCDNLEIGNLVNPLSHSTDVGFGWERLVQSVNFQGRVDDSNLFDSRVKPILRDHYRTLELLHDNGVQPGNKGRAYVTRRLLRRCINLSAGEYIPVKLKEWFDMEYIKRQNCIRQARRYWNKNLGHTAEWWWGTFGITKEEFDDFVKHGV